MSNQNVAILESLPSKLVIYPGVRTLTGLDLEQAIAENAQQRLESALNVSSTKPSTDSNDRNTLESE